MKVFIDDLIGADGEVKGKIFIESDSMQFIIKIYNGKIDGKGNEVYDNKGFYTTPTGALRAVIRMKVHESTATTLKELVTDMRRIEQFVKSKFEGEI